MLLLLYVNDISMAYPSNAAAVVKNIKAKIADKYRIMNLGAARQFLGIEITSSMVREILNQGGQKFFFFFLIFNFYFILPCAAHR